MNIYLPDDNDMNYPCSVTCNSPDLKIDLLPTIKGRCTRVSFSKFPALLESP